MNTILGILKEAYFLLNKMSIYLLFGFLFAGIIHVFLKEGMIAKYLGKNNTMSVIKASLFGIPLPLCSCGVVPAALSLKRDGASKGSILSFLISTPTTGVDSILATYSLLGGVFAFYRVIAAFITGVCAGIVANIFFRGEQPSSHAENKSTCKACNSCKHPTESHNFYDKVKGVVKYAFVDLLRDTGAWILIGILAGGAISYFIPETFFTKYMGSVWQSMLIMLIVGIPMYVCSSGSIPIAAALILKGLNPGAAFVFLMVGPATNSAALTVITKELGIKAVIIFLGSIIICSLCLGVFLNYAWQFFNIDITAHMMQHARMIPPWIEIAASIVLLLCIFYSRLFRGVEK